MALTGLTGGMTKRVNNEDVMGLVRREMNGTGRRECESVGLHRSAEDRHEGEDETTLRRGKRGKGWCPRR
jgi:hypothetical protein